MDTSKQKFAVMAAVVGIALTQLSISSPVPAQTGSQDIFVPTHFIGGDTEVTLKGDTTVNYHNSMICSAMNGRVEITQDQQLDSTARYWIYEYTGNERIDEETGKMDMSSANGRFYFSEAVLKEHPQLRNLLTLKVFDIDKLYYFMSDTSVEFSCNGGVAALEFCGDFIVQNPEECDDGNTKNGDGCSAECKVEAICGNGTVEGDETCDDGKTESGDGCSYKCSFEVGYTCKGEPSQCSILVPEIPVPEPDFITLHEITIVGESIVVEYSKNFATCAHMYKPNGAFDQKINFICGQGDDLTARALLSSFNETLEVGQQIKICHGNNGNLCSQFARVDGDGGGTDVHAFITEKRFGYEDTAVENQKDITLVRFEARAEGEDLLLTKVMFEAMGAGSSRDIQNYAIWVDSDGNNLVDLLLQDGGSSNGSNFTLDDMRGGGYVLPKDRPIIFELHGDVASSLAGNTIQMRFEIGLAGYIGIERLAGGRDLTGISTDSGACRPDDVDVCEISVTTTDSVRWSLAHQGDLFVTLDTTPIRNRQLLGGTLGEPVLRLVLHAETEDIDVTDLRFSIGTDAQSVDRLELYVAGESIKFADATRGGCGTGSGAFCANMEVQQLIVLNGTDKDILIRPRMKTDEQGGISGEIFFTGLTARMSVDARGVSSSNDLEQSNDNGIAEGEIFVGQDSLTDNGGTVGSIWGPDHVSVHSKITSITNANKDANGTAVPTGISSVGQFKFSAAAHHNSKNGANDVVVDGIIFNVNAANVAIDASSFKIYNKADQTRTLPCTPYSVINENPIGGTASGTMLVECTGIANSTIDSEIVAGSGSTFVLQADITNPKSQAGAGGVSVLQVTLQSFDDMSKSYGRGLNGSHIRWIDTDQRTDEVFDWIEYPETRVKSTSYNS